jgi:HPt (histidine-containing phosphotransfer) domain-containing protein
MASRGPSNPRSGVTLNAGNPGAACQAPLLGAKPMITRKIGQNRGLSGEGRHSVAGVAQASALDTSHLDAQVCGDPQLREELLRLYAETLVALAPVLAGAPGRARREAAHKLKGASLAIGAFDLARLCEGLEGEVGASAESGVARRGTMRRGPLRPESMGPEVMLAIEATRRRVMELLGTGRG